jgi:phosphoribosylformimino-5-aminoimidazole carboxamide ribotide isomerase
VRSEIIREAEKVNFIEVIPAIDLQNGKAVRLIKGDMSSPTVYSDNPLQIAEQFKDAGMRRLHLVDLDGAKTGDSVNLPIIEKIAKLGILTEVGGGIRNTDAAERVFNAGAAFVIVGTAAVKDKEFVRLLAKSYPNRVILGIDARGGFVATDGWYNASKIKAADLAAQYRESPIESVVFTDIEQDGTLGGVNLTGLTAFADASPFKVTASGGISCRKDIDDMAALNHPNIRGVIVGKAFYEQKITLRELAQSQKPIGQY